jgi:mono/diheme cytochrome c family protein
VRALLSTRRGGVAVVAALAAALAVSAAACSSGTGGRSAGGDTSRGEALFKEKCGSCHTLAAAGTAGVIGPNLDEKKPPKALVVERVTNGKAPMPPFKGTLTDAQIQAVADYVSSAAGK